MEFGLEFSFRGKAELVAAGEDFGLLIGVKGVFDHGINFIRTEDQAEGRVVVWGAAFSRLGVRCSSGSRRGLGGVDRVANWVETG